MKKLSIFPRPAKIQTHQRICVCSKFLDVKASTSGNVRNIVPIGTSNDGENFLNRTIDTESSYELERPGINNSVSEDEVI